MLPRLRATKILAASRAISMVPLTLVANTRSKSSRDEIRQRLEDAEPGVVDQHVEIAEPLHDLAIRALDVVFQADVGLDGVGADCASGLA